MTKHTDTSRSGDLLASLRALSAWLIAKNLDLKLPDEIGDPDDAADRIEALEASVTGLTHQRDFLRESLNISDQRIEALEATVERLRESLVDVAASLAAAISLLERGGKAAKKAAPSDLMFDQMVRDYTASLERARAALGEK